MSEKTEEQLQYELDRFIARREYVEKHPEEYVNGLTEAGTKVYYKNVRDVTLDTFVAELEKEFEYLSDINDTEAMNIIKQTAKRMKGEG